MHVNETSKNNAVYFFKNVSQYGLVAVMASELGDVYVEELLTKLKSCSIEELSSSMKVTCIHWSSIQKDIKGVRVDCFRVVHHLHSWSWHDMWGIVKFEFTSERFNKPVIVYGTHNTIHEGWCVFTSNSKTLEHICRLQFNTNSLGNLCQCPTNRVEDYTDYPVPRVRLLQSSLPFHSTNWVCNFTYTTRNFVTLREAYWLLTKRVSSSHQYFVEAVIFYIVMSNYATGTYLIAGYVRDTKKHKAVCRLNWKSPLLEVEVE